MLEGIQPVISVSQNASKDILNETQPVPVTIEKIVGEVSRTFNVSPADIRGKMCIRDSCTVIRMLETT